MKILDFGVALAAARETRLTTEGSVFGTPAYTAPEQVQGQRIIDAQADVGRWGGTLRSALGAAAVRTGDAAAGDGEGADG